jgi:hypothetical protein
MGGQVGSQTDNIWRAQLGDFRTACLEAVA